MRYYRLIGLLFPFVCSITNAQNKVEINPIELKMEHCLSIDSNMTTYGMTRCIGLAIDDWDKELHKYLNLLMNTLNMEEQGKLSVSQKQWLAYKEKEEEFSGLFYGNMQGTMWGTSKAVRRMTLLKQRATDLKIYYDTLNYGK